MMMVGVLITLLLVSFVRGRLYARLFTGDYRIGVIGSYNVLNPLDVSATEPEQLLSTLVFNSLISIDSIGRISSELAETWEISPDGRSYTFFLKKNIRWHDGSEFTAEDVIATFELLKSGDKDSLLGTLAQGLTVTPGGVYEVTIEIPQVNASFLELMTTPIVPDHIYGDFTFARLSETGDSFLPVGTGPYIVQKVEGNMITLTRNKQYFKGIPRIGTVVVTHFASIAEAREAFFTARIHLLYPIDAALSREFTQTSQKSTRFLTAAIKKTNNVRLLVINTKMTAENQSPIPFDQLYFRQALVQATDKQAIVDHVVGASLANGPYDITSSAYTAEVEKVLSYNQKEADAMLEKQGWTYPYSGALFRTKIDVELAFSLTFLDTAVNRSVATRLRDQYAKIGANVTLKGVTSEVLQQQVLPEKDYELLLFEMQTGIDPDQYGLWHSSQTTFPGLNLGSFASFEVDTLLEKGRLQTDRIKRDKIYVDFQLALVKQAPAVFLYHPSYFEAYFDIIDRKVAVAASEPSDRFSNIHEWRLYK
jgi:peptide/nickel transport system substrate-binding protein